MTDITAKFTEALALEGEEVEFFTEALRLYEASFLAKTPKTHRDDFENLFDIVTYDLVTLRNSWADEGVPYETQAIIAKNLRAYLESTQAKKDSVSPEAYFETSQRALKTDKAKIFSLRGVCEEQRYSRLQDYPFLDRPLQLAEMYL